MMGTMDVEILLILIYKGAYNRRINYLFRATLSMNAPSAASGSLLPLLFSSHISHMEQYILTMFCGMLHPITLGICLNGRETWSTEEWHYLVMCVCMCVRKRKEWTGQWTQISAVFLLHHVVDLLTSLTTWSLHNMRDATLSQRMRNPWPGSQPGGDQKSMELGNRFPRISEPLQKLGVRQNLFHRYETRSSRIKAMRSRSMTSVACVCVCTHIRAEYLMRDTEFSILRHPQGTFVLSIRCLS